MALKINKQTWLQIKANSVDQPLNASKPNFNQLSNQAF
jgi:hypothetical protein